ncbi:MAG: hypothetical protein ACRKFN_11495 [Desulfitobacterium sp.]
MLETYYRDFSINDGSLISGGSELEEIINNRQEKFMRTVEYQENREKALKVLRKLEALLPEQSKDFGDLQDLFFSMEGICFSAAYRDGMCDLMAAMTFNKLELTMAKYFKGANYGYKPGFSRDL